MRLALIIQLHTHRERKRKRESERRGRKSLLFSLFAYVFAREDTCCPRGTEEPVNIETLRDTRVALRR